MPIPTEHLPIHLQEYIDLVPVCYIPFRNMTPAISIHKSWQPRAYALHRHRHLVKSASMMTNDVHISALLTLHYNETKQ